tara:strand:+ start:1824 stop:2852 length:1029 start_codon:yes stop_codon:yes gene_type:complete
MTAMILNNETRLLITGGTGTFGRSFIKIVLDLYPQISRLVILSRDELKQWELQQEFPDQKYPQVRFMLGDIRDKDRLRRAFQGIDTVVHAAALKQVPAAEYNPMEFVKTNVIGAENIIQAALDTEVMNIIALSTDKAASPINLYGATKLCSDKLFISANNIKGFRKIKFSVVRYGNVMGSRGSVIPFFLKQAKSKVLPITDVNMTRFNITVLEGVEMVLWALNNNKGGEIFVPKIPSYKIMDLAEAIGPNCKKEIIGIRSGEKIDEELITHADGPNTIDLGKYYAILPSDHKLRDFYLSENKNIKKMPKNFFYSSANNSHFLSINEIRNLIKNNISSSFLPT